MCGSETGRHRASPTALPITERVHREGVGGAEIEHVCEKLHIVEGDSILPLVLTPLGLAQVETTVLPAGRHLVNHWFSARCSWS